MNNLSDFNDTVRPTVYDPPLAVIRSYQTPRFGRSDDIVDLLGSKQEQQDYIVGLILGGVIIFCVFAAWATMTLVFMCLGRRRVGFWSGRPFEYGEVVEHTQNDEVHSFDDAWREERAHVRTKRTRDYSHRNHPFWLRILFLLSGAVFIIFSILLLTKGVGNLLDTVNTFQNSLAKLDTLATATQAVLDRLQALASASDKIYSNLSSQVDPPSFCPSDPGLDFSDQVRQLQSNAQDAVNSLGQVSDVLDGSFVGDLDDVLSQYRTLTNPINQTLNSLNLTDWRAILPIAVVDVVVGVLMLGTVLAMCSITLPCFGAVLNYVFCPLLVLTCVVSWGVAGVMVMAAGVMGDFCLPGGRQSSPDDSIIALMQKSGFGASSSGPFDPYAIAKFYIGQCSFGTSPFTFVQASIPDLMTGQESVDKLESIFNSTSEMTFLAAYCGRDYSKVQELLLQFVDLIGFLLEASINILQLISCKTIVPLYVNTVYFGMCTYSPEAVYWVFKSALVMAVMSSIMLSLRASYKRTNLVSKHMEEERREAEDERRDDVDSIHGLFSPAKTGRQPLNECRLPS